MTATLPDPPPSAQKWMDLLKQAVAQGLVPFILLGFVTWRDSRREDKADKQHETTVAQMREDLKESRAETAKVLDKLISMMVTQQSDMKKDVKEVKTEVRATTDAVKASAPQAPVAPVP